MKPRLIALLLLAFVMPVELAHAACDEPRFVEERSLAALPAAIRNLLGADRKDHDGLADKDQPFQATDVIIEPDLPARRFRLAAVGANCIVVEIERGGIGYSIDAQAFEKFGLDWRPTALPAHFDPARGVRTLLAPGRFPWVFGMSRQQVSAIKEYGPYKSFRNGDLETYKGLLDGHEENFQFFFNGEVLRRIGVYLYEGDDLAAAADKWLTLFGTMSKLFGEIETPSNQAPAADAESQQAFKNKAREIVASRGKTQMVPITQATDSTSFASFQSREVQGRTLYWITLYFDAPK